MSLLFSTLSRFVIIFLPKSKCLLISWLRSPSAVILEPPKIKSVTAFTFSPSIFHEVMGPVAMISIFWIFVSSQLFQSPLSPSSKDSLVPLHFLPLKRYHLHIWGCWYFSWHSWFQLVIHPAWYFAWCILHRSEISRVTIYSLLVLLSQFSWVVPWLILTVASWPEYRFLRKQVRWSGIPISLRIFHSLLWSAESKSPKYTQTHPMGETSKYSFGGSCL